MRRVYHRRSAPSPGSALASSAGHGRLASVMRARLSFLIFFFIALLLGLSACHRDHDARSPHDAIQRLRSLDAQERRHAADELRDDGGPTPDAIAPLLGAI